MNLLDIPTDQFPLNHARYNHLMDELHAAARGFEQLQQRGWPNGRELDSKLMQIRADLQSVWELVLETERQLAASVVLKR